MDLETLKHWSMNSPHVATRAAAEDAFRNLDRRRLTPEEIETLERLGNSSEDWGIVLVSEDFTPEHLSGCRFEGRVELSGFAGTARLGWDRPGLHDSLIRSCQIDTDVSISGCDRIERVFVGRGAVIEGVSRLGLSGEKSRFGNDLMLFEEALYSRALRAVTGLAFDWAVRATGPGPEGRRDRDFEESLHAACEVAAQRFESQRAWVAPGARIRATPVVEDCWIGDGVTIDGAGTLRNSTILGGAEAPTFIGDGAQVHDSLVGPSCRVGDQSLVRGCYLVEAVAVGDQAILKHSLIGPNARLGECEINESFLGPFATALHHALVIAAWWPEGRGNIGYGANVGSNHTGRAPDQEIWPGEGVFFGLGCNIKLPANYRRAPYSLIATGADTLPQKVEFPFSLISRPSTLPEGFNRALNDIQPGWSLLNNAYGLERQERNQRGRNRARQTSLTTAVFRLELAPLLEEARTRLAEGGRDHTELYQAAEIAGLGKNFMSEAARRKGIEAYALGLSLIASRSLLGAVEALEEDPAEAEARTDLSNALRFAGRMFGASEPESLLKASLRIEDAWLDSVIRSKSRDDVRGRKILEDYAERHMEAASDPLIREVREDLEGRRSRLTKMVESVARSGVEPARTPA